MDTKHDLLSGSWQIGSSFGTEREKIKLNAQSKIVIVTLFEIFIFCPKFQLWFPEKIVDFFGWKTRENVVVLDCLAVGNFDFTRKIVKIEFLDKNLTFRIVWDAQKMGKVFFETQFTLRDNEVSGA